MNFWKRLRLIGSVIVLGIAVLALLLALRHPQDTDEDAPADRPSPALKSPSATQGL